MKRRLAAMFIVPALLIGSALASESQETRTPAATAPNSSAPETRALDTRAPAPAARSAVAAKVRELSAKDPVTIASAAYWLGEQGPAASAAVPHLAAVLGDDRPVNPARYRKHRAGQAGRAETSSPGQEAAAALAKIGEAAVETLINVLKTSPSAVARQNAAWALGVIQNRRLASAVLAARNTTAIEGHR